MSTRFQSSAPEAFQYAEGLGTSFTKETPSIKGVSPKLILSQVENTAPWLFTEVSLQNLPYVQVLQKYIKSSVDISELTLSEYFKLCLCAHYSTVATFVPTDLDIHIRAKLWRHADQPAELIEMGNFVLETLSPNQQWNFTQVSTRWLKSPISHRILTGHYGEWFSVAAAAFVALRKIEPALSQEIKASILWLVEAHVSFFKEIIKTRDNLLTLKAAPLIAHNLGDLNRVLDDWKVDPSELPKFWNDEKNLSLAGEINRIHTAHENHRHYALRTARALRKSSELLLGIGPFFDEWGKIIAKHPHLDLREVGEIVGTLIHGWEKLGGPVGYARALHAIEENIPGGIQDLLKTLPSRTAKTWISGELRKLCSISKERFEVSWKAKL